jgi:hypothetical protein
MEAKIITYLNNIRPAEVCQMLTEAFLVVINNSFNNFFQVANLQRTRNRNQNILILPVTDNKLCWSADYLLMMNPVVSLFSVVYGVRLCTVSCEKHGRKWLRNTFLKFACKN